jgi:hypothetical protein
MNDLWDINLIMIALEKSKYWEIKLSHLHFMKQNLLDYALLLNFSLGCKNATPNCRSHGLFI